MFRLQISPLVPSVGPSIVNATALSSSTVSIHWSDIPAVQQNGEIEGFKVRKVEIYCHRNCFS